MFIKNVFVIALIIISITGIASANQTITIDSIGTLQAGEKFNVTGTTTIENCKKIGIEIFPKKFWDNTTEYAMVNNSGKVRYKELAASNDAVNPAGINLLRYNLDGTQAYQTVDVPEDYTLTIVPVKKDPSGKMTFIAEINEKVKKIPFQPGKYHVNVYDATTEIERPGTIMPNGWDVIKKKIYPSTNMANLWDPKNEKDLEYAECTIR